MNSETPIDDKPLVSIVCGYYNRKENLVESINSVLNQRYENFEFIVFDDCSTDGTGELLASFKHPKLRLVKHEYNVGFVKGIIQAIALSSGKYIAIHGAGDVSFEDRIAKQVELLNAAPGVGIVGCLIEDVSKEGTKIKSPHIPGKSPAFTQGEVMYRRDLYFRCGGYNSWLKYGQFTPLWMEMLKYSESSYVDEVLYRRIHFENGVTKNDTKRIQQEIYYNIGNEAAKSGILKVNVSKIVLEVSLRRIALLKPNTIDEENFLLHARGAFLTSILYRLYRIKLLPAVALRKYGTLVRKISS